MLKNQKIWITNDILQYIININYTKVNNIVNIYNNTDSIIDRVKFLLHVDDKFTNNFDILAISLNALHNYFDGLKLFLKQNCFQICI